MPQPCPHATRWAIRDLSACAPASRLRRRCFEHWLPDGAGEAFHRPETALTAWRRLAIENLRREPEERQGFVLPYDPTPAERFGRDLPPVPNEMV